MMQVWLHRPQHWHLGLFVAAYVLAAGFAQSLAIVPGTGISIWPPSGLFIATLILAPMRSWPWWVVAGLLSELFSNQLWFHNSLAVALLIYAGNALEATAGAWLVIRACGRPVRLDTVQEVVALVILGAGVAPFISATVGSATLAWFGMQSFTTAWPLWWIGDATGVLIVAPLALVVFQNWRGSAEFSAARWVEACILGLIFLGVAVLSLSGYLPFAYIIMPPLLWAAVRFEVRGAVVALAFLALITAAFTISGVSQFAGDPESQQHKQIMLQLFLAISAFSALVVAAISRQHHMALVTLRENERELSQLIDMVPIHLWRLMPDGEPVFFNRRMADYLGMDVADTGKPGKSRLDAVMEAVHPEEARMFGDTLRNCLVTGDVFSLRYRLRRADGVYRWMSSRAVPMRDEEGKIVQWYGLCNDIDDQMHAEDALRRSEQQLQQIIDTVPAVIWCTTAEGIPCYLNKRATDVTGVALKDLIAPDGSRSLTVIHPDDRDAADQALARSFETGASFVGRYRQRRSDGTHRWVESRAEPLRDEDGKIVQWYGVSVDIDDLVTAQEALHDRERELSQLVNLVPVHIRRMTPEGEPIFFNKRLLDFFGMNAVVELDKPGMSRLVAAIKTLVHPDDSARLLETARHSFATGEPYSMRYRMRRADGEYRWVDGRAEPVRNQSGAIVQWYVISIDIDDEMRAQEALHERERELSQLVDMVPSLLWRLDPDGRPNFFNKRVRDFFGPGVLDPGDPEMRRLPAIVEAIAHPDDVDGLKEALNRCLVTGEHFSMKYRMRYADGVYRWVDGRAEPLRDQSGRITQWYGLSHDIDDQVRAQEALRERERELRQLIDTVPVQIWCVTPEGEPAYINKTMMDYIGLKLADFDAEDGLRGAIGTIVHPDDRTALFHALSHSFHTGEAFELKFRNRRWDGAYRWTEGHAEPLLDDNGSIIRWYGANIDIDDQVQAEEALRRSERQLQQIIDAVPVHIWSWTPQGEMSYVSRRYLNYLGLTDANLEDFARVAQDLVHPEDASEVQRRATECLKTGEAFVMQYRRREKDGTYRWMEGRCEPLRDQDGTIVQWYGVSLDIDDQMRSREELRFAQENLARASQAASLAELSASIAHEVGQPLAALVSSSDVCQRWLSMEPPNVDRAKIAMERIRVSAHAASDVVSRVRALFTQSVEARSPAAIDSVIGEARDLLADEATRRRVQVLVEVEGGLPAVEIDRIQIQQVLINLIRNGMEAMDALTVDKVLRVQVRAVGDVIRIEINDRGPGIEFPERIFEPFFTTKGQGMGMGLAICRSIVEAHGGKLWVEKNEPHGATFVFTLPLEVQAALQ
ncbi:PAS domain-containing protein [Rhizobiaceae bacterium n13]|uniref:histidine kinase n=1 Tax=Ferirhizobium litorale TaxID=2927786 RepID=A0AAE3QA91_9HYPH|nr:PAS domain-containing protein [Fererhizobium litorale]MDI7861601.1 PAS domain-containing protein [Fererhizobium litorale]MDI7922057.1 PAS domain-containing protein [Fererhizobium litorale]